MEVLWFLKQRTNFIRRYYETAAEPFREIICKIEAEEAPFEPPYSEAEEPAFMEEWADATRSLEILGAMCVSMLSEALKLYFRTWERELRLECQRAFPKEFKDGFVNGYKAGFGDILRTDWSECPANFDVIEQIVLARNDAQHHDEISELGLRHNQKVYRKYHLPFFLNDNEKKMIELGEYKDFKWLRLSLVVSQESLFEAIRQVEMLAEWMEEPLFGVKYGRR
ncbi:MAG: hypothetical protein H6Q99_1797 [Proteobacteria bacterium]|nr:hypothetical protein [Pseudomonadota bacterium]